MNQRSRQPTTRPSERAQVPSAVRVLAPESVPGALTAAGRAAEATPHQDPIVVRPGQVDELTDVVDHLRAGHAVVLELDGLDAGARRQGLAFVSGAAFALEIVVTRSPTREDAIVLDPAAGDRSRGEDGGGAANSVEGPTRAASASNVVSRASTCVLCDLRTADREFEPPLEMVIKRDGSRIWSPPAMVCSHCRETIRHWRFALAWCSECERWGRRNVVSPCGHLYG
jgi:hypothetical protein